MKLFSINIGKLLALAFIMCFSITSCDFEYALPEAGSQADNTLPGAGFSFSQSDPDDFRVVTFTNESQSSTDFTWQFEGSDTSTESDPSYIYEAGEGTYSVTLTVSDKNGISDTVTKEVTVIEPEEPDVPSPTIVNANFDKIPKSSGSDCACSGWINKDLGEQGESSDTNGDDVIKFDNAEPDHIYQEFEITPNSDFTLTINTQFKGLETGTFPSALEIRILGGSGYAEGYNPVYYAEAVEMPQEGFGYTDIADVMNADNNLLTEVLENPLDDSYIDNSFVFNSGENTSIALFVRGIGNADPPEDPADFELWGYCSGEEEIRANFLTIEAIN